jgi:hypothetical protein
MGMAMLPAWMFDPGYRKGGRRVWDPVFSEAQQ